ncbi:Polyketide cyclase/dehydrase [Dillenia turbinata]|uniref:Polyketide cyclase/dehydrase n=1 Tax=Dillenia turbinata TaxID=194707 RepID=A0AAN8VDK9_9MAGN
MVKDFFNLHRYFPTLTTCYGVLGSNGEPGCIRYCAGSSMQSYDQDSMIGWSRERLLSVDHDDKSITYEIVDCNIGFKSYVSTVRIIPGVGDQDGCMIEWIFTVDPVENWRLEDLVMKSEVGLRSMGKKMEEIVAHQKTNQTVAPCVRVFCLSAHENKI